MTVCFSICDGEDTILKAVALIPGLAIDFSCSFIISLLELTVLSFVLVKYKHTACPDPGLGRTSTDGEHEFCNLQRARSKCSSGGFRGSVSGSHTSFPQDVLGIYPGSVLKRSQQLKPIMEGHNAQRGDGEDKTTM